MEDILKCVYSPFIINFRELEDQRIKEEKEYKRREEEERRQRNIEEERRHKMEVGSSSYRKLLIQGVPKNMGIQ